MTAKEPVGSTDRLFFVKKHPGHALAGMFSILLSVGGQLLDANLDTAKGFLFA